MKETMTQYRWTCDKGGEIVNTSEDGIPAGWATYSVTTPGIGTWKFDLCSQHNNQFAAWLPGEATPPPTPIPASEPVPVP